MLRKALPLNNFDFSDLTNILTMRSSPPRPISPMNAMPFGIGNSKKLNNKSYRNNQVLGKLKSKRRKGTPTSLYTKKSLIVQEIKYLLQIAAATARSPAVSVSATPLTTFKKMAWC